MCLHLDAALGDVDAISAEISQKSQAIKCQRAKGTDHSNGNTYDFGIVTNAEHQEKGWNIREEAERRSWRMIQSRMGWENLTELKNKREGHEGEYKISVSLQHFGS